jgi:hypothetical protein
MRRMSVYRLLIALKGRGGACLTAKEGEGECLFLDMLRRGWGGYTNSS